MHPNMHCPAEPTETDTYAPLAPCRELLGCKISSISQPQTYNKTASGFQVALTSTACPVDIPSATVCGAKSLYLKDKVPGPTCRHAHCHLFYSKSRKTRRLIEDLEWKHDAIPKTPGPLTEALASEHAPGSSRGASPCCSLACSGCSSSRCMQPHLDAAA